MPKQKILFSSESVSEGHPDKVADQISDAILDACLALDPEARVACETFVTKNFVLISGEITMRGSVDYTSIARQTIARIGYTDPRLDFASDTVEIDVRIHEQSPDIAQGVNRGKLLEQGAGDQGIMFGYASNESEGYMPLAIGVAHKLVRVASNLRREGHFPGARPDMKSQVTIDYSDADNIRIDKVLMSVQHDPDVDMQTFRGFIYQQIMLPVVASFQLNNDFTYLINPTGRFVTGGPAGDTGLTGRKIIVDTYGGTARHGGGCFSGKDASKVDRSAAYMARYIAKNLVAAGVADRLEVQLAYAIGVAEPQSISLATFGTAHYSDEIILSVINDVFDCRPGAIIAQFNLKQPTFKYQSLAAYGHFGRPDLDLPFEKLDQVAAIKKALKKYKNLK